MVMQYNTGGATGSMDQGHGQDQINEFYWWRKSLIEAKKEMYFSQLADVQAMPKHMGKTIKVLHYMPLLDDRNINDQGIDASGAVIANGNLYGSSKDTGTITDKLPVLGEMGGRVNRVGFARFELEGSIHKFGMFTEYSQEFLDFDSDSELYGHISRELITGAVQLTEAVLQKDLLAAAGVTVYAGEATVDAEVTGEGATPSVVTYEDLMRLSRILNDNRTPKQMKYISGSRMVDTRTIAGGRVLYIGSELESIVKKMQTPFGDPAFVPIHQYANAGNILTGEIGSVDQFRIVVVPEMQHWEGAGAAVTSNPGFEDDGSNYNVYPMLCVGGESFTTIGFQTGGKMFKFKIINKKPGVQTADRDDPYGETGFSSIKWWYGFLALRPERIAVIKTVAEV